MNEKERVRGRGERRQKEREEKKQEEIKEKKLEGREDSLTGWCRPKFLCLPRSLDQTLPQWKGR